jgi:galactose mutarotase-like enzyme
VNDSAIFNRKFELRRTITCSNNDNKLIIEDKIKNCGTSRTPFMLLYHMNMGYPLLDENAELHIPSEKVTARDSRAQEGINEWNKMLEPQAGFAEQCYYHTYKDSKGCAMLFNKNIGKGLAIHFDAEKLDSLTEWKMMGERDYVLGLEPSNSKLEGRRALKENGSIKYLEAGEEQTFKMEVEFYDDYNKWTQDK